MSAGQAVRVAIVDDYEIVVRGLARVLEPFADRVEVCELVVNGEPNTAVDVVLYDTFAMAQGEAIEWPARDVTGRPRRVVFSWNVDRALIDGALLGGAAGYITKSVSAQQLVEGIERVHRGERKVIVTNDGDMNDQLGNFPGEQHGLSGRQAEVLALITQGLTNDQICDQIYISPNTLKTYIREMYRKIGVERRSQAVRWGVEHGFLPDDSTK